LTSENNIFRGHLTLPNHEIADLSAFYEVTFFLHLTQESAWKLFLQPQRTTSPVAISHPHELAKEFIIVRMAADPKPEDPIWYINTQRTVRKPDASGPKSLNSFEM